MWHGSLCPPHQLGKSHLIPSHGGKGIKELESVEGLSKKKKHMETDKSVVTEAGEWECGV